MRELVSQLRVAVARSNVTVVSRVSIALVVSSARRVPYACPTMACVRKTSVYLDDAQAERLAELARVEGRSQAEILRDAVDAYRSPSAGPRVLASAATHPRIDADHRPVSQVPRRDLLHGFGQ